MSNPIESWPAFRALCDDAREIGDLEVWIFGSALRSATPRDLDILVVYDDPGAIRELKTRHIWEIASPPLDVIAMTSDELDDLNFIALTSAQRVV